MNYYLDTEFNGFGGELISLALVREDGPSLYAVLLGAQTTDPWVAENVMRPEVLNAVPEGITISHATPADLAHWLGHVFSEDPTPPVIWADWPEDIAHLNRALITGPGKRVPTPPLTFRMEPVDSYPTELVGAVRHNAWWDAMALRKKLTGQG